MSKKNELLLYIPSTLPSFNRWNSMHYMQKQKLKKEMEDLVYSELKEYVDQEIKFEKVVLNFQIIWGTEVDQIVNSKGKKSKKRNGTPRDIINNAPSIKLVEDCIVRSGILKDDTTDIVLSHRIYADKVDRGIKGSGIIVLIEDYSEKAKPSLIHYCKDWIKQNHEYIKPEKVLRSKTKQNKIDRSREDQKLINDYVKKIKNNTADAKTVDRLKKLFGG